MSSRSGRAAAFLAGALLLGLVAAGARAAGPGKILGAWRGTSTCVGNPAFPACHDEVVVYECREAAGGGGAVTVAAFKIVNGEKVLMGEMDFAYDRKVEAWTSEMRNERMHALWKFVIDGDALTGTLVDAPSKSLVRNIAARREAPAPSK